MSLTERQRDQALVEDMRAQNLANLRKGQTDGQWPGSERVPMSPEAAARLMKGHLGTFDDGIRFIEHERAPRYEHQTDLQRAIDDVVMLQLAGYPGRERLRREFGAFPSPMAKRWADDAARALMTACAPSILGVDMATSPDQCFKITSDGHGITVTAVPEDEYRLGP